MNAIDLMLKASGSPVYAIGRARLRFPSSAGVSAFEESGFGEKGEPCRGAPSAPAENRNLSQVLASAERQASEDICGHLPEPDGAGQAGKQANASGASLKQSDSASLADRMRAILPGDGPLNHQETSKSRSSQGGFSPNDFLAAVEKSGLSSCFAPQSAEGAGSDGGGICAGRPDAGMRPSLLESVPPGVSPCVLMAGKMPFWSHDLELAMGGVRVLPQGANSEGMQAVAAIVLGNARADEAAGLPIIRAAGKKSLWKALLEHGLVKRPKG